MESSDLCLYKKYQVKAENWHFTFTSQKGGMDYLQINFIPINRKLKSLLEFSYWNL